MNSPWVNQLYFGDNLDILRNYVSDETVDLIYLDPPFNSQANYNLLYKEKDGSDSAAQIAAFGDFWHWDIGAEETFRTLVTSAPTRVSQLMTSLRQFLGQNDMMAYLTMMAIRLLELERVLKSTGSIYLHCDPTASHFIKILLDAILGPRNFRNEIIWHYRKWPTGKLQFQRNHDVIFFYSRSQSPERIFNELYMERAESTLKRFGNQKIVSGHDESGRRVPSQVEDAESLGVRQDDVWDIGRVPPIKQLFPTQKPEPLLERILLASSDEGDLVLDPFCGCGTTVTVAERLHRRWIGIDITHIAINVMRRRLHDTYPHDLSAYEVIGEPQDLEGARQLAEQDRYQFQSWALSLVGARLAGPLKKGGDRGIDGRLNFFDDDSGRTKQVIISVKSGNTSPSHVRDLKGVVEREKAELGAFITLQEPTRQMREEALAAGFYEPPQLQAPVPKLQVLTISDLLEGRVLDLPPSANITFKRADRGHKPKPRGRR
ncbi:MAG TPA: DNA methyltransferase [Armatimonadota bacterium]|jgi:site-specific DNA-methyltransferase (adenine-specific)